MFLSAKYCLGYGHGRNSRILYILVVHQVSVALLQPCRGQQNSGMIQRPGGEYRVCPEDLKYLPESGRRFRSDDNLTC